MIDVPDGHDLQQVVAAQRHALALDTGQPTAIVYHTHKGWRYGVEGKASHGAGHKLCSEGFYEALAELSRTTGAEIELAHLRPGRPGLRRPGRRDRARALLLDGAAGDPRAGARSSCRWRPRWRSGSRPPATGSTRASGPPGPAPRASTTPTSSPRRRRRSRRRRRRRRTSCASSPARSRRCAASSAAPCTTCRRPAAARSWWPPPTSWAPPA